MVNHRKMRLISQRAHLKNRAIRHDTALVVPCNNVNAQPYVKQLSRRSILLIGGAAVLLAASLLGIHLARTARTPLSPHVPNSVAIFVSPSNADIDAAVDSGAKIRTDRRVYLEPSLPKLLRAGDKFIDPVFGTEIMRASDAADFPAPGCSTFYSQWPTFNSNNTHLLIRCGNSGDMKIKAFDPVNFTLGATLRTSPTLPGGVTLTWEGATWSHTDPDLIFVHVNYYNADHPTTGMKLYSYRPSTNVFRLIKDFAPSLAGGKPDYLFEMHVAQDEIFTLLHKRVGKSEPLYTIIWKRSTDTILKHIATNDSHLPPQGSNAALPDKSGRWIVFPSNGSPVAGEKRAAVLDLSKNSWQSIYWTGGDDSPSHGDFGTGTMVGIGQWSGAASIRPLSDVHAITKLFDMKDANGVTDWSNDKHTTMYADDESWAMMSLYDEGEVQETHAFENEVMQFSTTDPSKFRRLLHHRSHIDNLSDSTGYWAIPKATISRDGRFIAFTSNWENSGRYDLFIARIDPPAPLALPAMKPSEAPKAPSSSKAARPSRVTQAWANRSKRLG